MKKAKLAIVVPCYNEEEVLPDTEKKLTGLLKELIKKGKVSADSFILFVNDGSKYKTWELIQKFNHKNESVYGLCLAGNVGHQNALLAGLTQVITICDISISIDADLQDDINVMEEMIDKYYEGSDIVYGVRNNRDTDSIFKRFTAQAFYKFMKIMGVKSVYNHADFRLLSQRALKALLSFPERNLFLRGLVPMLGFNERTEYYDRKERMAGVSKYPLGKMLNFALDGITSFSVKPLRLIHLMGLVFILIAIGVCVYALMAYLGGRSVPGWTSLLISVWFVGGTLLVALGIAGEYIGKIYTEVKRRPRYFEQERTGENW